MRYYTKICGALLLLAAVAFFMPRDSFAWRWPFKKAAPKKVVRPAKIKRPVKAVKVVPPKRILVYRPKAAKKYAYIKSHDINADGVVDIRDSVIWAQRLKGGAANILVSEGNADVYYVMDLDDDGRVDKEEIELFFDNFDLNANGMLEPNEIAVAAE